MPAKRQGKRGPLKVIKGKGRSNGVEIPIYASETPGGMASFMVIYYDERQERQRKRFPTLEKAAEHAEKVIDAIAKKTPSRTAFSAEETLRINDAIRVFQKLGLRLSDAAHLLEHASTVLGTTDIRPAVDFYAQWLQDQAKAESIKIISVPDAVSAFVEYLKIEGKSERDIYDVRSRLGKFSKSFTGNLHEIRTVDIDRYLLEGNLGKKSRKNNRTAIVRLFSFARNKGFLPREQATEAQYATTFKVPARERQAIEIYSVEQMKFLLSQVDRRVVPFVALGAFAGLRSSEIARLDWKDIHFDRDDGVIDLSARITKTASRRLVDIQPVLRAWLKPYMKKSGQVMEVRDANHLTRLFRTAISKLVDEKGKPKFKAAHNGLRHSFISYYFALNDDVKLTAKQAGNSPDIIFANYNEPVTKKEGIRWFNLMPSACGVFVDPRSGNWIA